MMVRLLLLAALAASPVIPQDASGLIVLHCKGVHTGDLNGRRQPTRRWSDTLQVDLAGKTLCLPKDHCLPIDGRSADEIYASSNFDGTGDHIESASLNRTTGRLQWIGSAMLGGWEMDAICRR